MSKRLWALVLALSLSAPPVGGSPFAAEWSVWNEFRQFRAPVIRAPAKGLRLPELPPFGRYLLPELGKQTGRLNYVGEMYAKTEDCIASNDPNFSQGDLDELNRLWKVNLEGLSYDVVWEVRYGLAHIWQGGGTAITNASCSDAKDWLAKDFSRLSTGTATTVGDPTP